jgi:hypothetical protein
MSKPEDNFTAEQLATVGGWPKAQPAGSETAAPVTEIKVGDSVCALAGAHCGKIGTALRVVVSHDEGRSFEKVLVSFPNGGTDYLDAALLEKSVKAEE